MLHERDGRDKPGHHKRRCHHATVGAAGCVSASF